MRATKGFTIVELLIVIIVIAILAAITYVVFTGVQERARSSIVQNDLIAAKKKVMLYQVDQGSPPTSTLNLIAADMSASKAAYDITGNNFYYCFNTVTKEFAMGGRTAVGKSAYLITSNGGIQSIPAVGGTQVCQAAGLTDWTDPNAFITNGYTSGTGWLSWVTD